MANIGEFSEVINSNNLTLEVGSPTPDVYITLTNLVLDVGRPESRKPTTGGIIYTYGKGDHSFTATLSATTPELSSLNTLNETDANGDLTPTSWLIHAANISGGDKFFQATGVLRHYQIRKGLSPDSVEIDIDVRITGDTITISNTAP